MPRGGQNRKTVLEKRATGTFNVTRERQHREKIAAQKLRLLADASKVGPPPKDLTPRERRIWAELAPLVDRVGMFADTDAPSFRLLVSTTARLRDPKTSPGGIPSLTVSATRLSSSLGLVPLVRASVPLAQPEGEDFPPPGTSVTWAEQLRIWERDPDCFRPVPFTLDGAA